jgi:hypothetical protein
MSALVYVCVALAPPSLLGSARVGRWHGLSGGGARHGQAAVAAGAGHLTGGGQCDLGYRNLRPGRRTLPSGRALSR